MCSAVLRSGNGGTVYLCCVGAVVCQFSKSGDDYGCFAFVSGRGAAVRQADVRGDAGFGGGAVAADFDDEAAMIAGMVPIALGIGAVGKLAARWRWR